MVYMLVSLSRLPSLLRKCLKAQPFTKQLYCNYRLILKMVCLLIVMPVTYSKTYESIHIKLEMYTWNILTLHDWALHIPIGLFR